MSKFCELSQKSEQPSLAEIIIHTRIWASPDKWGWMDVPDKRGLSGSFARKGLDPIQWIEADIFKYFEPRILTNDRRPTTNIVCFALKYIFMWRCYDNDVWSQISAEWQFSSQELACRRPLCHWIRGQLVSLVSLVSLVVSHLINPHWMPQISSM